MANTAFYVLSHDMQNRLRLRLTLGPSRGHFFLNAVKCESYKL